MSLSTPASDFLQIQPEIQSSRILSPYERTEFELNAMREQQRRLNYFTDQTAEEQRQTQEEELFINQSLVTIFRKLSSTIIAIINELLEITKETQFNDILLIFIKEDRLVYIGILILIISLAIYLIDLTG